VLYQLSYARVKQGGDAGTSPPPVNEFLRGIFTLRWGAVLPILDPLHNTTAVRDEYIKAAQKIIPDPNVLINVVSRRVKQLKYGHRPLVESLERLSPEDTALREIIEGKISYELYDPANEASAT
jgi:DNA-directed RNA polymerase subunit omega